MTLSTEHSSDRTTYPAVVGFVLASQRQQRGLEQAEVGAHLGLSQPSWSRIERGETALSIEQLAKAAKLFGVSPGHILKQADEYVSALGLIDVAVEPERPDRASSAALAVIGGAVLAFLIAKALSK